MSRDERVVTDLTLEDTTGSTISFQIVEMSDTHKRECWIIISPSDDVNDAAAFQIDSFAQVIAAEHMIDLFKGWGGFAK